MIRPSEDNIEIIPQFFCELQDFFGTIRLLAVFMQLAVDESHILVEAEDGASQEERLGDVIEQSGDHIVNLDDLIGHKRDAAHDEQHRTTVLRDFEAFVLHRSLHECGFAYCAKDGGDDVTDDLEDSFYCFVHNRLCFSGLIIRLIS